MSHIVVSVNPHIPNDIIAEAEAADPSAVAGAAARAAAAADIWHTLPAGQRAETLNAAADAMQGTAGRLTDLIIREVGKPRREAAAEVSRGVGILRYFAQQCLDPVGELLPGPTPGSQTVTRRRPRGVAGVITPWNFPVAIPLWKAAPALAYGNGVLWKPSSFAIGVARELAALLQAVLPADLIAQFPGEADTARAVIDSADVISFTGSTAVGQSVITRCAARGIPCQAEMGGSNYAVIAPSADLARAATQIAAAAYAYAGQKCTATSHVLVVGDQACAEHAIADAMAKLRVGDPGDPDSVSGPLIHEAAARRCADAWCEARDRGARLVCEVGERSDGAWQPLRLAADVPAGVALGCEEVFGPIATITSVAALDEAIAMVNSGRYGLVSALYTQDLRDAAAFSHGVRTGMVKVNAPTTGVDYWAPFGGDKDSSYGPREQGTAAAQLYTSTQTTTVEWPS